MGEDTHSRASSTAAWLAARGVERSLYPYSGRFVDVGPGRMHVIDEGDGPCVVLLHGNPTWSFLYRRLIEVLRHDFRVIAPDHLGCGLSDRPPKEDYGYTLRDRVADLDRLLEALAVDRASFVLHDWGGMIGLRWLSERADERRQQLVLLNTAGFGLEQGRHVPLELRLARAPVVGPLLVRGLGAFEKGAVRRCVVNPLSADIRRGFIAPYSSWASRLAVHEFVLDIPLDEEHLSWQDVQATAAWLPELDERSVLVAWGLQDFVFDRWFLERWREILPGADFVSYPEAGHFVLEDEFDDLAPRIRSHLLGENG